MVLESILTSVARVGKNSFKTDPARPEPISLEMGLLRMGPLEMGPLGMDLLGMGPLGDGPARVGKNSFKNVTQCLGRLL